MTWVIWNLASFRLETVLVSVQDRCMVCARRTDEDINTDDASASTPVPIAGPLTRARARKINHQVLILMQDWCTVCVERTISSEIVLDAPDGTPR